jgi:hypothetical protein
MRTFTHAFFSMAVALWAVPAWQTVVLAPMTTLFIDILGHSRNHGMPRRGWVTHDWVLSLFVFVIPLSLLYSFTFFFAVSFLTAFIINAITLYTHLMLDSITGHTFIMRRVVGNAYVGWDNPLVNISFLVLGAVLIVTLAYLKIHSLS